MKDDDQSSTDLVATIIPPEGDPQTLIYESNTPSGDLVRDSTGRSGIGLSPEYTEAIVETVERSRGLIDGGIRLSFKMPEKFGGWGFEFERKPRKEIRIMKKAIYRPQKR